MAWPPSLPPPVGGRQPDRRGRYLVKSDTRPSRPGSRSPSWAPRSASDVRSSPLALTITGPSTNLAYLASPTMLPPVSRVPRCHWDQGCGRGLGPGAVSRGGDAGVGVAEWAGPGGGGGGVARAHRWPAAGPPASAHPRTTGHRTPP